MLCPAPPSNTNTTTTHTHTPSSHLPTSPPTVSHLGPGSIHPDGGFIFVFVCLLIHESSYSGHHRGFRSTTECKSPRRLIHFHLSLVDIQLLSTFLPDSCSQDISLSFRAWDQACSDQASLVLTLASTICMSNTKHLSPPTHHSHLENILLSLHIFPSSPLLTLAPHRGSQLK